MEQSLALEGHNDVTSGESARAETIGRLFDEHHARLYRLALRLTWGDDDARDLVQECFLRALSRRIPDDPRIAERWLVRVLVNLCRDRGRCRAVRQAYDRDASAETLVPVHDPVVHAAVRAAVLALPVRQRAVIVLHEIEGMKLREVAEVLGIAAVTARWHLHAALRTLRKELSS